MNHTRKFLKRTEGAAAIIIACSLFALIGVASLAIDMGQMYTVRNQMQNMVDAAALAGVGQLIQKDASGNAVWRTDLAQDAALKVSHDQAVQDNLGDVADGDRNDMTIVFGTWNINAGNPATAWTANTANPNAMQVVMVRNGETVFGPVTSLFAKALGYPSTNVSASAIAFLGYTSEVPTSGIELPLALPATGASSPLACNGHPGWFARLIGPTEAVAAAKTIKFRDTGGSTVLNNVPTSPYAPLDANQPYFFTPKPNPSVNSVPNTVKNIIAKNYTPTLQGTTSVPVYVGDIKIGDQIYPASEYCWGSSYLKPIFDNLKTAYNAKKDANGNWQTTVVVHGPVSTSSLFNKTGFMSLARLLNPFSAPEAIACATIQPPTTYVKTFANVTITGVTSGTGDDGNYTYPKTVSGVTYTNKKDFLNRYPTSSWNVNTATIDVATNTNTVSPPGTLSGGPSNGGVNPSGSTSVGAFATVPRLVK